MRQIPQLSTLLRLLSVTLLAATLGACSSSEPGGDSELSRSLEKLLLEAANGEGLSYFAMPASDDFGSIPQDPKNPITAAKVELGQMLYHEPALTVRPKDLNNLTQASCASCHHADAGFQAGIAQGIGSGGKGFGLFGEGRERDPNCAVEDMDIQPIRTPTAMNGAWQPNMLWNGQFGATHENVGTESAWTPGTPKEVNHRGYQGLETQAIAGQDVHRMDIANSIVSSHEEYTRLFDAAYPELARGDRITDETAGLAIAAYERTLLSNRAPFQKWLAGDRSAMNDQELRGAIVFFGAGECASCHTGPALNSMEFHAIGLEDLNRPGTYGFDPSKPEHKGRGGFTGRQEDMYRFKVPQLYNLVDARFLGHGASFTTLRAFVEYMNAGVPENESVPSEQISPLFRPLNLNDAQVTDLVAFLESGLRDPDLNRYVPSAIPSGFCFPNNDPASRIDRDCD